MHTLKNLILPFKKYKVAAILNIIGLSVAFASFTIITTQVKYDFSFDRHYKNKARISGSKPVLSTAMPTTRW